MPPLLFDLKIVSEEENGIDFAKTNGTTVKGLSLPMIGTDWNNFYDDNYQLPLVRRRTLYF